MKSFKEFIVGSGNKVVQMRAEADKHHHHFILLCKLLYKNYVAIKDLEDKITDVLKDDPEGASRRYWDLSTAESKLIRERDKLSQKFYNKYGTLSPYGMNAYDVTSTWDFQDPESLFRLFFHVDRH